MAKTPTAKRPDYPLVLIAHDLRQGGVVYINPEGWSQDFTRDAVATDDETADRLAAVGARAVDANILLDLEWIGVGPDIGAYPRARDIRERIKLSGPTIFADRPPPKGPNADAGAAGRPQGTTTPSLPNGGLNVSL